MKIICEYCESYVDTDEYSVCPYCLAPLGSSIRRVEQEKKWEKQKKEAAEAKKLTEQRQAEQDAKLLEAFKDVATAAAGSWLGRSIWHNLRGKRRR